MAAAAAAASRALLSGCALQLAPEVLCSGARLLRQTRALHLCAPLCAGHNKWSKVKDVKIPKDAMRSRLIVKYLNLIRVAVKEGGPKPEFNVTLAHLIEQCKSKNIPKSTIDNAIKGGEKSKSAELFLYEVRGPGGCLLLVEVLTDNNTRSYQDIKHIVVKSGGVLSDGGRHHFERKGVVVADRGSISTDRALELAIESGAEDVQEKEDEEEKPILQFICDTSSTKAVRTALEDLGVQTLSTGIEYISNHPTPLPQAQLESTATLLDTLNDYPDVVRIWDNVVALE